MAKVRALKSFTSTIWGTVDAGQVFNMDEGYVKSFVDGGMVEPVVPEKPAAPVTRPRMRGTVPPKGDDA